MQINMYNVEFGDCFLICDENENLLVDFGSDNSHCDISAVAKHIKATNGAKELSCLISHFHEDHMSGFLQSSLVAKNIYIPDIIAMSKTVGKLSFLQLSILSDIFKWISVKQEGKLSITLYDFLLKIGDQNSYVHFLQRGTLFTVSSIEYQVLWPDLTTLTIHGRVEKRIIHILEKLGLITQQITKEYSYPSEDEKTEGLIINEIYPKEPLPIASIDPFITKLVDCYTALADSDQSNHSFDKEQLQMTYNKMVEDIKTALSKITGSASAKRKLQQDLSELYSSMKKQANKYCVVFHDTPENGLSSILMTGDITPPEFNKLLTHRVQGNPQISVSYNIIKAPHHGTTTYFTPYLPKCKMIMASNGEPSRGHSSWHKICYRYGSFYQSHKGVRMLCSNLRCDLRDLPETPNCSNCGNRNYFCNGDSVSIISP